MNYYKTSIMLLLATTCVLLAACKKQWDDHTAVADQHLEKNLMEAIQENSSLSTFAGFLNKLGYDKMLSGSKTYTIWVPDNQALSGLDPALVSDTAKLRAFVNNHIANLAFFTTDAKPLLRVRTLGGKRISFTASSVEDAGITSANFYANNGVLHVVNKQLPPKLNILEFIRSMTSTGMLQRAYILGKDTTYVDTSKATVTGIDPLTGKPILQPGTGLVNTNTYADKVAKISSEDSLYTYFVLTDEAYNAERNKVARFFKTVSGSIDTTMNRLAAFNVLKDVAVKGVFQAAELGSSLVSVGGVRVPVNKAAIQQTYQASNGIVYVISSMDFALADKITPIVIQGESATFFTRTDRRNLYGYRTKKDPSGLLFNDLLVSGGTLTPSYYAGYRLSNLYTCQYKVVWRAINDWPFTTPTNISQRLGFASTPNASGRNGFLPLVQFPYTGVTPLNYDELQLLNATNPNPTVAGTISVVNGTLSVDKYASVNMFLQGSAGTVLNSNIFTADYIKLIPIL